MIRDRSVRDTMPTRQKLILAGLYLSKYDSRGLKELGFDNFVEAFNVIGYALRSKPASVKNYRDEFDPLFPNPRKGWHKRSTRDYCLKVLREFNGLDFESFTGLVKSFFGLNETIFSETSTVEPVDEGESTFSRRLITGLAAEQYFESVHMHVPEFGGYSVENTTRYGCGYDFRLRSQLNQENFLAVEVKGLRERTGSVSLTPKEYDVASNLRERFFLFIVRNFRESPSHDIFKDPLSGGLAFRKVERVTIQVSWLTSL